MRKYQSMKNRVFSIVDDVNEGGIGNRIFEYFIISLILLNLVIIFIETYQDIYLEFHRFFDLCEYFIVFVFTIEYFLRIWTCTCYPEYQHPIIGRIKFAFSINQLIDLLAIFPFYAAVLIPMDPRIVKLFRLIRLFRIFKLIRYYGSAGVIVSVLQKNRDYLYTVTTILIFFLIFIAYIMYILESEAQPENFQNIGSSFWWAVVTLTTVGYGDIFPITPLGKMLTSIALLIGIGIIALPTGIIASGFLEEMRNRKECPLPLQDISIADEISKIQKLKEDGVITEEEFEIIKSKLIK